MSPQCKTCGQGILGEKDFHLFQKFLFVIQLFLFVCFNYNKNKSQIIKRLNQPTLQWKYNIHTCSKGSNKQQQRVVDNFTQTAPTISVETEMKLNSLRHCGYCQKIIICKKQQQQQGRNCFFQAKKQQQQLKGPCNLCKIM